MHSTIWGRPAGSQGRPLTSCEKGGLREGPLPSPGRGAILNWRGGGRKAAPHACVSRASWAFLRFADLIELSQFFRRARLLANLLRDFAKVIEILPSWFEYDASQK